jgi:hypothetical protein
MLLINGFIRYVMLLLVFSFAFMLEGGHPRFLIFDTLVMEQFLIFCLAMLFYMETLNPQTPEQLRQTRFAGLAGAVLAIFIPILGGLIHYLQSYENTKALGGFLGVAIISPLHTIMIYFSFFHWAQGPRAFEGLAISQKYLKILSEKGVWRGLLAGFNYLLYGVGVFIFVGFLGFSTVMVSDFFDFSKDERLKIWRESREAVETKLQKIEDDYIAKNCKAMPDDEKEKIENELKAQQDKIEEEKIYKLDHGETK